MVIEEERCCSFRPELALLPAFAREGDAQETDRSIEFQPAELECNLAGEFS
jgi:hypothetical protein